MRLLEASKITEACDYLLRSAEISYPVDKFVFEHIFEYSCKIKPLPFEVELNREINDTETKALAKSKACKITKDAHGNWTIRLERKNPIMNAKYKVRWMPPQKKELEGVKQ